MNRQPRRFDLIELLTVAGLLAGAGVVAGAHVRPSRAVMAQELQPFAARYGPDNNSSHGEEWLIRDFFHDRRGGVFVDVGANHYRQFSNTYYLETALGWSGLAIEPLRRFEADYLRYRPRTRFRPFFVSDRSNEEATLYYSAAHPDVTSASRAFTEHWAETPTTTVTAPTITLDDLLAAERLAHVDFLSIDIELAEPKALAGFTIERVRPTLVCIEAHPEVRQAILDYFAHHQYVLVGKYLRADSDNLYFTPLSLPD